MRLNIGKSHSDSNSTAYLCGGTLVTHSIVVTAAHCVTDSALSTSGPVFTTGIRVLVIAGQVDRNKITSTEQIKFVSSAV